MTVRTTNWDAIITSAPLNKQAAVIRDGASSAEVQIQNSYAERPALRDFSNFFGKPEDDLRGKRFGYWTVVGLSEKRGSWVCECTCGRFSVVTTKGLRIQAERNRAMCGECDYYRKLQAGEVASPARRLILRSEKQAAKAAAALLDEALWPHFERLVLSVVEAGYSEKDVLPSFTRWNQWQRAQEIENQVDVEAEQT